ncbi:MAG: TlpA family protein disulfide reductase [Chitinophagaceae bacterium]|nr:TlpA family protein disulfide reductase [Chitinophagaceae bacterium]
MNKQLKRILLNEYIGIEFLFYMAIGMMHAPVDTLLIKKVLTETDPESDYWQIYTLAIKWYEIIYDHDKAMNCLNLLFRNNNDAKIKSAALYYIIELQKKYNQPYENYYQQLLTDFPQSTFAETAKDKYNPLGAFAKGRKIPAFSVRIMGSDAYFDTRQLKKKYYIIDFWATWCAPCIAELPELEKLYAKFKDRDLEIVSISIDKTKDAVKRFREKRFAMPWQHVVLDKGYDDPLLKALDIGTIPRIVLIDPRGVIIGSDDDLRNGKLDELFSSILNGSYKN